MHLHATSLTPVTGLHNHAQTWRETLQTHGCMRTAKATYLVGLEPSLSPLIGLPQWVHLKLASCNYVLVQCNPTSNHHPHYHVWALGASDRATDTANVLIVELSSHTSKMMPRSSEKS